MLKIYGSMLCPDCIACCEELSKAKVSYEFLDFSDNLRNLKEFLAIRDREDLFSEVRIKGSIGIPCIVNSEGDIALNWDRYVTQAEA